MGLRCDVCMYHNKSSLPFVPGEKSQVTEEDSAVMESHGVQVVMRGVCLFP